MPVQQALRVLAAVLQTRGYTLEEDLLLLRVFPAGSAGNFSGLGRFPERGVEDTSGPAQPLTRPAAATASLGPARHR